MELIAKIKNSYISNFHGKELDNSLDEILGWIDDFVLPIVAKDSRFAMGETSELEDWLNRVQK